MHVTTRGLGVWLSFSPETLQPEVSAVLSLHRTSVSFFLLMVSYSLTLSFLPCLPDSGAPAGLPGSTWVTQARRNEQEGSPMCSRHAALAAAMGSAPAAAVGQPHSWVGQQQCPTEKDTAGSSRHCVCPT